MVQDFGRAHKEFEVQIVRPGLILSSVNSWRSLQAYIIRASGYVTSAIVYVDRADLSAVLLDQVTHGFEKEILSNADLVRIGDAAKKTESD